MIPHVQTPISDGMRAWISADRWPADDPAGLPCGRFHASGSFDRDGQLIAVNIVHADPRVVATDEFARDADPIRVDAPDGWQVGGYVTLRGDNRAVLYRIKDRDEARCLWLLEWPD